nr:PREDICTED: uncharacterized protein LOC109029875 [Bemisia tabaci]
MWKNLRIPNPKVNLTVRNSQRRNGYAPPIRHLRENPANSVFDVPSIHCGTIFEDQINDIDRICSEKVNALQHQMQEEIENQTYKYHQALRNCHNPVQVQQIQNAHFTSLAKTRELFENKRDQLQREAEWEKERLQDTGHEVVSFHEFYDDLDGEKPEYSTRLSEEEFHEITQINEMLKEYYQFYQ